MVSFLLCIAALWLITGWLFDMYEVREGMDLTPEQDAEVERRVQLGMAPINELDESVESLRESMGVPYIGPERRSWRAQR